MSASREARFCKRASARKLCCNAEKDRVVNDHRSCAYSFDYTNWHAPVDNTAVKTASRAIRSIGVRNESVGDEKRSDG